MIRWFAVLAVAAAVLTGCGGNDCNDACDKFASCVAEGAEDLFDKDACVSSCEAKAKDSEVDCVVDASCSELAEGKCG